MPVSVPVFHSTEYVREIDIDAIDLVLMYKCAFKAVCTMHHHVATCV